MAKMVSCESTLYHSLLYKIIIAIIVIIGNEKILLSGNESETRLARSNVCYCTPCDSVIRRISLEQRH